MPALISAVLLASVACCQRAVPEDTLRADISALQTAIEARDVDSLRDFLAEDFIGNDGLDRSGARRLAVVYFMRNRNIGVTLGPLDVTMHDGRARVDCTAALTGGSGQWVPESGRLYNVHSGWRLEQGQWRLTSLEWTPR